MDNPLVEKERLINTNKEDKIDKELYTSKIDNNSLIENNILLKYLIKNKFIDKDDLELYKYDQLLRGNEYTKEETCNIVKDYYDNEDFEMMDVVHISKGTTKQDELFDYVDAPDYLKERPSNNKEIDDYCL